MLTRLEPILGMSIPQPALFVFPQQPTIQITPSIIQITLKVIWYACYFY